MEHHPFYVRFDTVYGYEHDDLNVSRV